MNDHRRPTQSFEQARNAIEEWRQRQIAALTEEQRHYYEQRRKEEKRLLAAEQKRAEALKAERIEEEKRRRLLTIRDLAYRMLPARRLSERKAEQLARDAIERLIIRETAQAEAEARKRLDNELRRAESQREQERQRAETAREITEPRTRTAFNAAARGTERAAPEPQKRAFTAFRDAARDKSRDRERE